MRRKCPNKSFECAHVTSDDNTGLGVPSSYRLADFNSLRAISAKLLKKAEVFSPAVCAVNCSSERLAGQRSADNLMADLLFVFLGLSSFDSQVAIYTFRGAICCCPIFGAQFFPWRIAMAARYKTAYGTTKSA